MDIAIFVAKGMALLYLAAGVAALSGKLNFDKIVDDFNKSPALTFITGMITMIIGLLIVENHNVWTGGWPVLITLLGWISLVKGFVFMAFPNHLKSFKGVFKNTQAWGFLLLALAAVFGYLGFMA